MGGGGEKLKYHNKATLNFSNPRMANLRMATI